MINKQNPKAFTLVEMLIVIVIIGILAAALIPRVINAQARARDTARTVDLRNVASAMDLYYTDNGGYPVANYTAATDTRQVAMRDLLIPTAYANTPGSSLSSLQGPLSNYLKSIPRDPRGQGVKTAADGSCVDAGDSYGYYTIGAMYAITAISESNRGNASSCGNTVDRAGDGGYKKEGVGLTVNIQGSTPTNPQGDACFGFSNGTITSYHPSCPKNVVIPATINGQAVTSIAIGFDPNEYISINIPASVTNVSNYGFGIMDGQTPLYVTFIQGAQQWERAGPYNFYMHGFVGYMWMPSNSNVCDTYPYIDMCV